MADGGNTAVEVQENVGIKKLNDAVKDAVVACDENGNVVEENSMVKIIRSVLENKQTNICTARSFNALHLNPELLKGVKEMGFKSCSQIQEMALPLLLADPPRSMIIQSQSGTGKTATFTLAMLSRVDTSKNHPQVLCVCPTYELAVQIGGVATRMAKFRPDIRIRVAVHGEELPHGHKLVEHVIIGTPGKVQAWSVHNFDLPKIKVFVMDESDVMIQQPAHLDLCLGLRRFLVSECQLMLLSATYEQKVLEYADFIVSGGLTIRLKKEDEILDNIKMFYVKCISMDEKYKAIVNINTVVGKKIVFCHTRKIAKTLVIKLAAEGLQAGLLTSELTLEQRLAVLDRFRSGSETLLITTNVLSRGIDIEGVSIVVIFDLPINQHRGADYDTYLHRVGRAGRFGKRGVAINFVDSVQAMSVCRDIEQHFGKEIKLLVVEKLADVGNTGAVQ